MTPPNNDDENKRPLTNRSHFNSNEFSTPKKEKKSSTPIKNQIQYRILQRGQPDEPSPIMKKPQLQKDLDTSENSTSGKSQRNRSKLKKYN